MLRKRTKTDKPRNPPPHTHTYFMSVFFIGWNMIPGKHIRPF